MNQIAAPTVDPMVAFREKVTKKLREDIAGMIPDEALNEMARQAIQQEFFQPRVSGSGYNETKQPSWFVEEVAKAMKPLMQERIKGWVDEHEEELERALENFISTQSILLLAMAEMQNQSRQTIFELVNQVTQLLKRPY